MNTNIYIAVLLIVGLLSPTMAPAAAPTCHSHTSGPYCAYTGTVKKAYVNTSNRILFYFDTPLDLSLVESVGLAGITHHTAASISISEHPDFAKSAYATMLAAQARGATVSIQLRGNAAGYLKIDRIWINE